jgi:hypothetical protein
MKEGIKDKIQGEENKTIDCKAKEEYRTAASPLL